MSSRKPPSLPEPKRARERRVTPEETSLWRDVTSSVAPSSKAKARVRVRGESRGEATDTGASPEANVGGKEPGQPPSVVLPEQFARQKPPLQRQLAAAPKSKAPEPPAAAFDRRKMRHLASGKIEIDARLDLHGLRQSEARYRLIGFIRSSHDRGCRMVLVITGKGAREPIDRLADARGEPQRGILRRVVPQWLDEPDMRAYVIGFTSAGPRHGGEGALYVSLRRAGRFEDDA